MENDYFTVKSIGELPHWNTIHGEEYGMYNYSFETEGLHPIYFTWEEVSDLKVKHANSIVECAFKLNLSQFGMEGHEIPVMNFMNDKFEWLFYKLDENNKIIQMEGRSEYSGISKFEDDVEYLMKYNHCDYKDDSTTVNFKGQFLKITKNEEQPPLKRLTQEEVDAYMETQECDYELELDDPMYYFIAFDDDDKAYPQDDQYEMKGVYDDLGWSYSSYFGAVPLRNQNGFQIPSFEGKEMLFAGQFSDGMFRGFDTYNYVFYDQESRTVAIFQQMT